MTQKAMILGVHGKTVTPEERAFFADVNPWGFILFARNVESPDQLRALTLDLRECVGRENTPILMDQEGGRVQRLRPPHWGKYPPASTLGALYDLDPQKGLRAAWLHSRLMAFDLLSVGVNVNCLPVLDVPSLDGHDVIGDRAYGRTPEQVSKLGSEVCQGSIAGGVMPVIKHIPGHGRANCDSHMELPIVPTDLKTLAKTDFQPFIDLNHIAMAMTAHVIYSAIDDTAPATTSKVVMNEIIRGHLSYDGLIMCDDITMNALSGGLTKRTRAIFDAGCDIVLHCTGEIEEMKQVAESTPALVGKSNGRAVAALKGIGQADELNEAGCKAEFSELIGHLMVANAGQIISDPTNYGSTGNGSTENGKIA